MYPTFVYTPAISHAGNRAGGQTSVPPGSLDSRTAAKAVVRLADHPLTATVVGMPAAAMKLSQFITPNLISAIMNGFMGSRFGRADPAPATDRNLFAPPPGDGQVDGGFRHPDRRRRVALAFGGLGLVGAVLGGALLA